MINSSFPGRSRGTRTVDEHRTLVLEMARTHTQTTESVLVSDGLNRILSEDLRARWDIPRFAQSAMDGFAVRFSDFLENPGGIPITTEIFAGESPEPLAFHTAARIMTGAAVPEGADTVIRFEDALVGPSPSSDSMILLPPRHGAGTHIRFPGEDVRTGDTVMVAGTRLDSRHVGALAALGYDRVPVMKQPRVSVITTGDELLAVGEQPERAQIIDSNGPYLVAALSGVGALVSHVRCGDNPEEFEGLMEQCGDSDLIVVTGGASVGDRDVARDVLRPQGVSYVSVLMQPGKPQGAGLWHGTPVLSLPGNPVSVAVSHCVFVRPLLDAMLGVTPPEPRWGQVTHGWTSTENRRQYYPVRTTETREGCLIEPATPGGAGSHLVTSLARATAFAVVPETHVDVNPGDRLELLDID